ncbi:MAG: hypothetical protein E7425_09125 [Ruminococcaceae bacterium]|nr:hypothetical protein [Oscillospiraceae bacterium]
MIEDLNFNCDSGEPDTKALSKEARKKLKKAAAKKAARKAKAKLKTWKKAYKAKTKSKHLARMLDDEKSRRKAAEAELEKVRKHNDSEAI